MKKSLCLLLAFILVFSLSGCFADDDVRGEILEEDEFSLGSSTGNTYKNDFLGLRCTLPASWIFYSDEQILELNNMVGDMVDEDIAKALAEASIVYDMCATEEATGSSININLEKLSISQLASLNIQKTLEAQIDAIKETYKNIGYSNTVVHYEKITVDGREFDALKITATIYGTNFYGITFSFRKGRYLANVSLSTVGIDTTGTLLNCFTVS